MRRPVSISLAMQETESEMRRLEEHQRVMQDNLQKSAEDISVQLAQVSSTKSQLEEQKQVRKRGGPEFSGERTWSGTVGRFDKSSMVGQSLGRESGENWGRVDNSSTVGQSFGRESCENWGEV